MMGRCRNSMLTGLSVACLIFLFNAVCAGQPGDGKDTAAGVTPNVKAITLARDMASEYSIYCDKVAPDSVKEAAAEIQKYMKLSTGAALQILNAPKEPMIVLGDTPETRRAGIDTSKLPEEGFRIETKEGNIFIAGKDTRDNERTPDGGFSDGTYYGAMEFLERVVGVRWLGGVAGWEHVPQHRTLTVQPLSFSDAPDFQSRTSPRIWIGSGQVNDPWRRHMRISEKRLPIAVDYNHAWNRYGMVELLKGHPECMAMGADGRRRAIEEQTDAEGNMLEGKEPWKFCTTNRQLLDMYSDAVCRAIAKEPSKRMWSIAPNDGGAWCECKECVALDEPCDPALWPGNRNKSMTRRIFTFYNEIARRVKVKHPDKLLGCFAYSTYTYPPAAAMDIEPNLFVMLAARPYYGFSLYHEDLSREFLRLVEAWDSKLHGRVGWFDYSTWVGLNKCHVGAPYPPGIPILKLIFPELKKHGWKTLYWATLEPQGYAALYTYLASKLMWKADADVDAMAKDWLICAYGPGGEPMGKIYELLDKKLAAYKQSQKYDLQYRCVPEQVKAIHLPIFPQMEELYKDALSKAQSDAQRGRIEMFGKNLFLLHWNMRKAGWLDKPEASIFYKNDNDFKLFVEKECVQPGISLNPTKPEIFLKPQLGQAERKSASVNE